MKTHFSYDVYEAAYLKSQGVNFYGIKTIDDVKIFTFEASDKCKTCIYDFDHGFAQVKVDEFTSCLDDLKNRLFSQKQR